MPQSRICRVFTVSTKVQFNKQKSAMNDRRTRNPSTTTKGEGVDETFLYEEIMGNDNTAAFSIFGRIPAISSSLFTLVALGMGVILSEWEPTNLETKTITMRWLGLVGEVFSRVLNAVILPLVFIRIVISVLEIIAVGRARSVAWLTIGFYITTSLFAAIAGITSVTLFKGFASERDVAIQNPPKLRLACKTPGYYLTEMNGGSVMCVNESMSEQDADLFLVTDVTESFVKVNSKTSPYDSMSDTLHEAVATKLITDSILADFATANFAAVAFFAAVFSLSLTRVLIRLGEMNLQTSVVVELFRELEAVFSILTDWILEVAPLAIWSLVVKAVGTQENLVVVFDNVEYLIVSIIVAIAAQILVYLTLLLLAQLKKPLSFLQHLLPAQILSFACASSITAIPMTLRCAKKSGQVPLTVLRFVTSFGSSISMDGSAIYLPCACVWVAALNGVTPSPLSYVLLIVIATIGSVGTVSSPSSTMLLTITAYNAVFNSTGTPDGFESILAIEWLMAPLRETLNTTGTAVVSALVAARLGVEVVKSAPKHDEKELACEAAKQNDGNHNATSTS